MKRLDTNGIHLILLGILKDIDEFCTAQDITYTLAGGTLLGAVRHKGFIPWDEDADIVMPRPEFDRFVASYGNDRYGIVPSEHRDDSPDVFPGPHIKVQDKGTLSNEGCMAGIYHYGVSVDVFPIDGLPDDPSERRKLLKKGSRYRRRLTLSQRGFIRKGGTPGHDPLLAKIESRLHTTAEWQRMCYELSRGIPFGSTSYAGCVCGVYGPREAFPLNVFRDFERLPFENLSLNCTARWDEYLTGMYGDYMTPPPSAKRKDRHFLTAYVKED